MIGRRIARASGGEQEDDDGNPDQTGVPRGVRGATLSEARD